MTIVESAEQADAAERGETESREHDAQDLDAQIRAANAAEKQIFPSWLAAVLSGIGTGLIVWTLALTRQANRIALQAADSFKATDRAWLGMDELIGTRLVSPSGDLLGVGFGANWRNVGNSPAHHAGAFIIHEMAVTKDAAIEKLGKAYDRTNNLGVIAPTLGVGTGTIALSIEQYRALYARKVRLVILTWVNYNDAFSKVRRTSSACFEVSVHSSEKDVCDGDRPISVTFQWCGNGNTAT